MKKKPKFKGISPKVDPYLEGLVSKMIERLVRIEHKLDTVLSQKGAGKSPQVPQAQPQHQPQPQRHERQLYEAICADCSKVCEVPFRPTENRAVYCKECWAKRKSGGNSSHNPTSSLRPVALPPKPKGGLYNAQQAALKEHQALSQAANQKTKNKKTKPAKKSKKKK